MIGGFHPALFSSQATQAAAPAAAVLTNLVLKTTPPQTPTAQPTMQLQSIQIPQQSQPAQAINIAQVELTTDDVEATEDRECVCCAMNQRTFVCVV